jgi:hypothetical protein
MDMGLGDLFENIRDGLEDAKDKLVDIKEDIIDVAGDLSDNVQYGLEEARDNLEDLKDDRDAAAEDFADEPKEGLLNVLGGFKEVFGPGMIPIKNPALALAGDIGSPFKGPVSEIVGSFLKKKVTPTPGCIVICKIAGGLAEHSGVYIGDDTIVELNGSGEIQEVSFNEFLSEGITRTGVNIYVACDSSNRVISDGVIAERAEEMVGDIRDYNLVIDNCHQFTAGCITGNFENADNFFFFLTHSIKQEMNDGGAIRWLVCME